MAKVTGEEWQAWYASQPTQEFLELLRRLRENADGNLLAFIESVDFMKNEIDAAKLAGARRTLIEVIEAIEAKENARDE